MWRLDNLLQLAHIALPFLKIYFTHRQGSSNRRQVAFWSEALQVIPELKHLPDFLRSRIRHYQFANSLTMQWFNVLHNKKPSAHERNAGWYLAVATPIADFLVDELGKNAKEITSMMEKPENTIYDQMAHKLLGQSQRLNSNKRFMDFLYQTLRAQEKSLLQKTGMQNVDTVKQITWEKGGFALLLYRTALSIPISSQEEKAIFQIGGLMQLHNDIFDLFRDTRDDIQTLPTHIESVNTLKSIYEKEVRTTIEMVDAIPVAKHQRKRFLLLVLLAVNTGYVCLAQYEALEKRSKGKFTPKNYTKHELICDMDQWSKIAWVVWKTINYKIAVTKFDEAV
ncbi:MAG: hypothetical protein HKN87_16680 [Saprospiraceae bacterium]|nr:hypothetical protein [Saprospiraceae bacterium]